MVRLAALLLLAATARSEDASVRRVERSTVTYYGYAYAPSRTGTVSRVEVWHCEANGQPLVSIDLPPTASPQAKQATALAAVRAKLGNPSATLRVQP